MRQILLFPIQCAENGSDDVAMMDLYV